MIPSKRLPGSSIPRRWTRRFMPVAIALSLMTGMASADPILEKAEGLLKTGRPEAAAAIYSAYLKKHPGNLDAQLALSRIAIRRFEFQAARRLLEQALAQHPDSAETAATIARLYQRWASLPGGEPHYQARAREHFTQATSMDPDNPLVLSYLAEWQMANEDLVSAEKNLQKAMRLDPDFIPAYQANIRYYMRVRDLARAKDAALHAMELDPINAETHFLTAQLLALANRPAEAADYAQKSEQLDYGRMPERDAFLAAQYEKLGRLADATRYYETLTVYTPQDANIWVKLAELHDRMGQSEQSMDAYRKAIALKPALLEDLRRQARDHMRQEKIELALGQWRRLMDLQPNDSKTVSEGLEALASLHALHHFYQPAQPHPAWALDWDRFEQAGISQTAGPLHLARVKMQVAKQGMTPALAQELTTLGASEDPAVSGEALFLAGQYAQAHERLDAVVANSADEYIQLADRLLLDQELVFSRAFYQRAYELEPQPSLQTAIQRIDAKQALAAQRIKEGDLLFNQKNYEGAAAKYIEATRIHRQGEGAYLRLADTYERIKDWSGAKQAYDQAISLSPGLMESESFAKNYQKLAKRVR